MGVDAGDRPEAGPVGDEGCAEARLRVAEARTERAAHAEADLRAALAEGGRVAQDLGAEERAGGLCGRAAGRRVDAHALDAGRGSLWHVGDAAEDDAAKARGQPALAARADLHVARTFEVINAVAGTRAFADRRGVRCTEIRRGGGTGHGFVAVIAVIATGCDDDSE